MKAQEAKKMSRWVTLIHRIITIILAALTGTGLIKENKVSEAIKLSEQAVMMREN